MNEIRHGYAACDSDYWNRWRNMGNMQRARRSTLPLFPICVHDGAFTLGRYSIADEPREWVRLPYTNEENEIRATSIIRRRSLTHIKRSGYVGLFFLGIGMTGLIVSMFIQIPSYAMCVTSGVIIGGRIIARVYGH
jgi:hypothetical protein